MNPERFERQDVVNGLALAGLLLFLGFLMILGFRSLDSSVGDIASGVKETTTTSTTAPIKEPTASTEEEAPAKEPSDVIVRVGNGANKSGLATSGTRLLSANEYRLLQGRTKEGPTVETSTVYYSEGFKADARLIAGLLEIDVGNIQEMPEDPGVEIETANVVVILGEDAEF